MSKINTRSTTAGNTKNSDSSKQKEGNVQEINPFELIDDENPTIKDIYKLLKEMIAALNFNSKENDEFKIKITALEKENEKLKLDADNTDRRLQYIETDYYYQQQQQLQNHITVHGIPKQNPEELTKTIINIATTLKVNITAANIKSCRTIPSKNKTNPTPIIAIEFTENDIKKDIQKNFKNNGPVIVSQILKNAKNTHDEHRRIYVNDYLCSYYKQLLEDAKKLKEKCKIKFVWTKNGNIYARQTENATTFRIRNYRDLANLEETLMMK